MGVEDYNKKAWDSLVENGNEWTIPVDESVIAAARDGDLRIVLTPKKHIPSAWYPDLSGSDTLCLASGGGQQGPVLAAAGAVVTVFDNSPKQLAQDAMVGEREGLEIKTVEGDMRDLSCFDDDSFDLIVHPCSNGFVSNVLPVWREAFRVLRSGGVMLAGFVNPVFYIFDYESAQQGTFTVRHKLPYSDEACLTAEELDELRRDKEPLSFSHTLETLVGGQTDAGFLISGFYEDTWPGEALSDVMPLFIATRSIKP